MSSYNGRHGQKLGLSQDSQVPMQYQLPTLHSTGSPLLMLFNPLSTQNPRWKHTTEKKFVGSTGKCGYISEARGTSQLLKKKIL